MRRPSARCWLAALVGVLVAPMTALVPAHASATRTVDRTALSAYIVGQLYDANSYQPFGPGYPDTGLGIDAALALSATGGHAATVARIAAFAAGQAATFADPTNADDGFNGGSVGKLALLAEVIGADPHGYGGYDLIAALAKNVCTAADVHKDSAACSAAGLYRGVTSTFGQSLGLIAQGRSGGAPAAAVAALITTRCPDGSFRSLLPPDGACGRSGGDVDSTSMVAQALTAVGGQGKVVDAAVAWIAAQQRPDGGFPGAAGDNTNSAALAIQAMLLEPSTYTARIAAAQAFLTARQNRDGGLGISTTADGVASDVRASTQGLSGVVGTSFAALSRPLVSATAGAPQPGAAARGISYLTSTAVLTGGTHVESGGYVDYGLTADIAIALAAAGGPDARLKAVVTYLRAHVAAYADPAGRAPGFPGPYSGALAKLALLAEITGQDPRSFGGYELLGLLRAHQCARANAAGTCTAEGDFYQAFSGVSQALGVLALARAGSVTATDPSVLRLRQLQCPDGGFSSTLPPASPCVSDVDTTGFALQALALVPDDASAAVSPTADALLRGQDYVLSVRRSDGSYLGAAGNNTNSTALAVQAFLATPGTHRVSASGSASSASGSGSSASGRSGAPASPGGAAIRDAVTRLGGEQNADGGFGINAGARASDARASAQVVPALTLSALNTLRHPVVLAAFVAPRTTSPTTATPTSTARTSSRTSSGRAATGAATSSAVTSSAATATAGPAVLANTGIDRGALERELSAALVLLAGGGALIAGGRRRRPRGRHR